MQGKCFSKTGRVKRLSKTKHMCNNQRVILQMAVTLFTWNLIISLIFGTAYKEAYFFSYMCNAFTRYIEELNKHMLPMFHLIHPTVPWDKVLSGKQSQETFSWRISSKIQVFWCNNAPSVCRLQKETTEGFSTVWGLLRQHQLQQNFQTNICYD